MARVRGDPITTALAHPTRRSAYIALSGSKEMSTVQLQEAVGVDRYNLYHHLKKLASLELVENHRDEGRARWWRVHQRVNLPELLNAEALFEAEPVPIQQSNIQVSPSTMASIAIDEEGRDLIVLDLEGSRDQVSAKQLITRLSEEFGLTLDVPWNFIPERLVLYAKKR
ncbi:MAG: helix-turn-helix transcriptional regulator [Candidatus Poseidonia sp.]|nr:helix-turn-helix transcriptional regulator [Poseidonia sp.]MBL6747441.1 helix-turn-helix transcriptional regulator [Poseidonia sp.]MBL6806310.1 helix-turn-helix transcriptional regulator [Poseidonia sp.]